jgi:hypothetical protein
MNEYDVRPDVKVMFERRIRNPEQVPGTVSTEIVATLGGKIVGKHKCYCGKDAVISLDKKSRKIAMEQFQYPYPCLVVEIKDLVKMENVSVY